MDIYKQLEDARGDCSEGTAEFYWSNGINECVRAGESNNSIKNYISMTNTSYIISTCSSDVNIQNMSYKFGKFMVEIVRPTSFLERLNYSWNKQEVALPNSCILKNILYNKYERIRPPEYLLAPPYISIIQKPRIYQDEMEYRFIMLCRMNPDVKYKDYLYLDVDGGKYVVNKNIYRVRQ